MKAAFLTSFGLSVLPLESRSRNVVNGILKDFNTDLIDLPFWTALMVDCKILFDQLAFVVFFYIYFEAPVTD
jgi:hypothetical protein